MDHAVVDQKLPGGPKEEDGSLFVKGVKRTDTNARYVLMHSCCCTRPFPPHIAMFCFQFAPVHLTVPLLTCRTMDEDGKHRNKIDPKDPSGTRTAKSNMLKTLNLLKNVHCVQVLFILRVAWRVRNHVGLRHCSCGVHHL